MKQLKYIITFTAILLFVLSYFVSNKIIDGYLHITLHKEAKIISNKKVTQLYIDVLDHKEIVRSISKNRLFNQFLSTENSEYKSHIEDMFMTISMPNRYLFQLRYLDENGKEVIRVDKTKDNKSFLVKEKNLQNKRHRYYFSETMNLDKDEIWYSKVDLNIEHGKIEQPIRPTLRVATPVFDNENEKKGILIANISIKQFFHKLSRDAKFDMFIIDSNGEYLYHKDSSYSWSKYLNKDKNITNDLEGLTKEQLQETKFYYKHHFFQKLSLDNTEGLLLVITPKGGVIESMKSTYQNTILVYIVFILVLVVLLVFLFFLQREKKQKEQIMESQRMASMGEMIGNIAHQWRQPLSVISTAATGMQVKIEYGIIELDEVNKNCEMINNNAQYLSKTIDDFRNFIKGDRTKALFNLSKDIKSFLNLAEGSIKNHNLQIILDLQDDIQINGYENELIQCLMNIFNNAKDILKEKQTTEKLIFISTSEQDEEAIIKIKDNGGGIAEEILPKIFEPYFTTKHQSQGTGLGLHMTYNLIVDGMGGKINAQNVTFEYNNVQYQGVEFIITIPK